MNKPDSFRLVPVLLPGAEPDAVQGFAKLHMWADFRKGLDDSAALQRLRAFILGEAPKSGPGNDPKVPKPEIEPYRGLEPFEGKHAIYFFGRDNEIKDLCGRLQEWPFTAVIGGSGSGKSSIVRAGLQTELATQQRPALAHTTTITVRPGSNPIRALADQVVASLPEPTATITERLKLVEDFDQQFRTGSDKLLNVLRSLYPRDDKHILLVIDQFEELFTHSSDNRETKPSPLGSPASDSQQTQFVELLAAVAKSQLDRLRIVITLRADFFDRCLSVPTLKSLIENRTLLLGKLSDDALRTVIEAPAFKVGAYFEKGLVARILKDVENQNGSLPLLQHALKELWGERCFSFLTNDGYKKTGGVEGALKQRANATLQNLNPDQREIVKNIFLRLTTLGEGVSDTRRRVRKSELYPEKTDPRVIDAVLKVLSSQANRLILISKENVKDDDMVEVTHEALIQRWDTLKDWLAENRDDKRLHDRLRDAADEWIATSPKDVNRRDYSYLWDGGRLDLAEKFDQTRPNLLSAVEREFLSASLVKRERATAEEERRRQRELQLAQEREAEARARTADAEAATERERQLRQTANEHLAQAQFALGRLPFDRNNIDEALLWFCKSCSTTENDAWRSSMTNLIGGWSSRVRATLPHEERAYFSVFSPDGHKLVTSCNHHLRFWNSHTGQPYRLRLRHEAGRKAVAFTPNAQTVLIGDWDNSAWFWDLHNSLECVTSLNHNQPVRVVAISPDGETLLTGTGRVLTSSENIGGEARLWDARTGQPRAQPMKHSDAVSAVTFSPDGTIVLTGCWDGTAQLWDAATGTRIGKPWKHHDAVIAVAFNPEGKTALTACYPDGTLRVWQVRSGKQCGSTLKHNDAWDVTFSPDGQTIIARDHFGMFLWNARTRSGPLSWWSTFKWFRELRLRLRRRLQGNDREMALCTNGDTVRTGSYYIAMWWASHNKIPNEEPIRHAMGCVAFSPAGDSILVLGSGATAHLVWDGGAGRYGQFETKPLVLEENVDSVAFSPDGKVALTSHRDCNVRLWDANSVLPCGKPMEHDGVVSAVAFRPDGNVVATLTTHHLATGGIEDEGEVRFWDVNTSQELGTSLKTERKVTNLAWSPDGTTLITGGSGAPSDKVLYRLRYTTIMAPSLEGYACLWDPLTGQPVGQPLRHDGPVHTVAFSPDSRTIVTACRDTARLWDARTGQPFGEPMTHDGAITDVALSPDGRIVLTGSSDSTARTWNAQTGQPYGVPFKHLKAVRAVTFSSDSRLVASGSEDETVQIWDLSFSQAYCDPIKHNRTVTAVSFTPDGLTVVTACDDQQIRFWDLQSGLQRCAPIPFCGYGMTLSPDGHKIIVGNRRATQVWNMFPPAIDDRDQPERLRLSVEVRIAKRLDGSGKIHPLSFDEWVERRQELAAMGGPCDAPTWDEYNAWKVKRKR